MTLRRRHGVVPAMGLSVLSLLCADVSHGQGRRADLGAVAAVVRHVAPHVQGEPPQPVYLAYLGKTPPAELWKLVSEVRRLEAMPPSWKPGADESTIELLDVWAVRRNKSGEVLVSTQVVGPVGLAVEGCTYTVRLIDSAWQVDPKATRCVVL